MLRIEGEEADAVRLVARIGLLAWLNPVSVAHGGLRERVEALAADIARLPEDTRAALQTLLADPEAAMKKGSRTSAVWSAIGGYSDGPRIDALLRFPGAEAVVAELGERAARTLD